MGVSKNRGIPKWMVKIMEKTLLKWMIWGGKTTIFGNIHLTWVVLHPLIPTLGTQGVSLFHLGPGIFLKKVPKRWLPIGFQLLGRNEEFPKKRDAGVLQQPYLSTKLYKYVQCMFYGCDISGFFHPHDRYIYINV